MAKLIPLILELDDPIAKDESVIDIKTIGIQQENHILLGYVAVIKKNNSREYRYGNLKARRMKVNKNDIVL